MQDKIGLYIHIPFCKSKCAYCDFYSGKASEDEYDIYVSELIKNVTYWGKQTDKTVSSVYFGGGTPSILGTERLCTLLNEVKKYFSVSKNAEITLEANPESGVKLDFRKLNSAGFNRLSVGLQSSNTKELEMLGRIHTPEEAAITVKNAKAAGFVNISLDIMLGIPHQTKESLNKTIEFCESCGVQHISAYLLKIEEGTRFDLIKDSLALPDEDEQAQLYLYAVELLETKGFKQYEISNFSVPSFESRHNTLYWKCGEYIGIGPAAHSFLGGKRFHYERSKQSFYNNEIVIDGNGGDEEEYLMLSLRLKNGLSYEDFEKRFNKPLPSAVIEKINKYSEMGLMETDGKSAGFTPRGFLVSNSILSDII